MVGSTISAAGIGICRRERLLRSWDLLERFMMKRIAGWLFFSVNSTDDERSSEEAQWVAGGVTLSCKKHKKMKLKIIIIYLSKILLVRLAQCFLFRPFTSVDPDWKEPSRREPCIVHLVFQSKHVPDCVIIPYRGFPPSSKTEISSLSSLQDSFWIFACKRMSGPVHKYFELQALQVMRIFSPNLIPVTK